MRAEDIEIPETAQHRAEPVELDAQAVERLRIEHVPHCAQNGPKPPDGRAHLVKLFGVCPEPRAWLLCSNHAELLAHEGQDLVTGRAAGRHPCRASRGHAMKYLNNVSACRPDGPRAGLRVVTLRDRASSSTCLRGFRQAVNGSGGTSGSSNERARIMSFDKDETAVVFYRSSERGLERNRPRWSGSASMPRHARQLNRGYQRRGDPDGATRAPPGGNHPTSERLWPSRAPKY